MSTAPLSTTSTTQAVATTTTSSTTVPTSSTTALPTTTSTTEVPVTASASPPVTASSSAPASSPTFGLTGAWTGGGGFGQVKPSSVFLGGDPTGDLRSVQWSSWGGAEATGTGQGWYVSPNESVAQGTLQPAVVVAFDRGECADHPAYQEVEWYFAGKGDTFEPSEALYTCAEGYVSSGTDKDPYSPWVDAYELFGDVHVIKTITGSCSGPSFFDINDQYAWRCTVQGGALYDPCFAPGIGQHLTDVTEVACADSPWVSGVTVIKLAPPLTTNTSGTPTDHFAYPWAFQLANGDQCETIEGTGTSVGGVTFNYGCSYGDAAYPHESVQPWTAPYALNGSDTVTQTAVVSVWY